MKSMIPFFTMLVLVGIVASVQAISVNNNNYKYPNLRNVNPNLQRNVQMDVKNRVYNANPKGQPHSVLNQNISPRNDLAPSSLNVRRP